MRATTTVINKVFHYLYESSPTKVPQLTHGVDNEPIAFEEFRKKKASVRPSGLYIDLENPYLAASPGS